MNLARSRSEEARLVERAKIVRACLDGKRNDEVSRELGVRPNTVGLWRKRFAAIGVAAAARVGRVGCDLVQCRHSLPFETEYRLIRVDQSPRRLSLQCTRCNRRMPSFDNLSSLNDVFPSAEHQQADSRLCTISDRGFG